MPLYVWKSPTEVTLPNSSGSSWPITMEITTKLLRSWPTGQIQPTCGNVSQQASTPSSLRWTVVPSTWWTGKKAIVIDTRSEIVMNPYLSCLCILRLVDGNTAGSGNRHRQLSDEGGTSKWASSELREGDCSGTKREGSVAGTVRRTHIYSRACLPLAEVLRAYERSTRRCQRSVGCRYFPTYSAVTIDRE